MENVVKIGSFREVSSNGSVTYLSYREFIGMSEEDRAAYYTRYKNGGSTFFCACSKENDLPLIVTSNGIIRVASNNGQENHLDSCPKSVFYSNWLSSNNIRGVMGAENELASFDISLPSFFPGQKSSSSSSGSVTGEGQGSPRKKRMKISALSVSMNLLAWEVQTFTKKKAISEAAAAGTSPSWEYKDLTEFNKFLYGISHNVRIELGDIQCHLSDLYYNSNDFLDENNLRRQWFFYAKVDRCTYKDTWKWQYVTVCMPSDGYPKTTIRMLKEHYEAMFGRESVDSSCQIILSGFVKRVCFQDDSGNIRNYVQLTKGVALRVNDYGLIAENDIIRSATEKLSKNHVIFVRPRLPFENYLSSAPTLVLPRNNGRDIWVDFCKKDSEYEEKKPFVDSLAKDILLYLIPPEDKGEEIIKSLCEVYGR